MSNVSDGPSRFIFTSLRTTHEQKPKKRAAYAPLEGHFLCTYSFLAGFPPPPHIPANLLVFFDHFVLFFVLLSGVFFLAAPESLPVPRSPILDLVTLCFQIPFPSSSFALYSPPKLYRERHATSRILSTLTSMPHHLITIEFPYHDTYLYNLRDTLPPPYPAYPELNGNREQSN